MKSQSRRVLLWFSFILLILSGVILSPLASLVLAALALLCVLPTILFGSGFQRWIALCLLMGAVGVSVMYFGKGSGELQQYQQRVKSDKTSVSLPDNNKP